MSCYYAELLHHSMMIHLIICVHIIVQYILLYISAFCVHTYIRWEISDIWIHVTQVFIFSCSHCNKFTLKHNLVHLLLFVMLFFFFFFYVHGPTHIYHISTYSYITHEHVQISRYMTWIATNRLGDRLQRLQTIPASFGVSWAVLNLNDGWNNLNLSPGSLYANRLWCKDNMMTYWSKEKHYLNLRNHVKLSK